MGLGLEVRVGEREGAGSKHTLQLFPEGRLSFSFLLIQCVTGFGQVLVKALLHSDLL